MNRRTCLALLITVVSAFTTAAQAQAGKAVQQDSAMLVGDWRGDSICVVRPSACNDEKALYHFKKTDKPNRFLLQADKIVNGQAEEMGTMECTFAPEKHDVTCSTPRLVVHLTLNGKSLDGTMNRPDGTLWRNISLKKDGA